MTSSQLLLIRHKHDDKQRRTIVYFSVSYVSCIRSDDWIIWISGLSVHFSWEPVITQDRILCFCSYLLINSYDRAIMHGGRFACHVWSVNPRARQSKQITSYQVFLGRQRPRLPPGWSFWAFFSRHVWHGHAIRVEYGVPSQDCRSVSSRGDFAVKRHI